MKVEYNTIFNLMDTNGRRNDVINALQGYLVILDDILNNQKMIWGSIPDSFAQYEFYKQAIALSPDVFKKHKPYDKLVDALEENPNFKEAIVNRDIEWVFKNADSYNELIRKFDLGIEDRARHYTSNLVKLGFTDDNRIISSVGELLLNVSKIKKDNIEKMLPIDGVNIVYLRQMMKLRIFDENGDRYYSPFALAIYILLQRARVPENVFLELVQGLSPYSDFSNIDKYVEKYKEGDIVKNFNVEIPVEVRNGKRIIKNDFYKYFKNRKSDSGIDVYWKFYNFLYDFFEKPSDLFANKVINYYDENRQLINKAFGCGKKMFNHKSGDNISKNTLLKTNKKMFECGLNEYLYEIFSLSKRLDLIREYSDTTKRIFKATGIISFDNGYVELAYKEVCELIFDKMIIESKIYGVISDDLPVYYEDYEEYEKGINSYYCNDFTLSQILEYHEDTENKLINNIQSTFQGIDTDEIPLLLSEKRKKEFCDYIEVNYPVDRVKTLLSLFSDRRNDKMIKENVSSEATVPTIYEYIVGIAWYYFSGKRIDLLSSYNLTMSANFEPIMHAGGGQGDIVIYEDDKVVMLEATLMNTNSQKRGEWEPVLRHSINLKVEEEVAETGREVLSFFVADDFDRNTINIWKAVAMVPLQSSINKDKYTDNVVIMPIRSEELADMMDKSEEYNGIINKVRNLFEVEKVQFDMEWREKFMASLEE